MSDEVLDIFENYTSKDILISNLTFASFFIAIYESVKCNICDKVKNFYGIETLRIENGKLSSNSTDEYKRDILDCKPDGKKNNTFFASLLWLKDGGAIDDDDYDYITHIVKDKRNLYAHNLFEQLDKKISKADFEILKNFLYISKKINKWWVINIEGLPEDAECVFDVLLKQMYNMLFGENYEI